MRKGSVVWVVWVVGLSLMLVALRHRCVVFACVLVFLCCSWLQLCVVCCMCTCVYGSGILE